ncbi:Hypothetical protein AA314_07763 [Archangium gephyra]|uniref:Uncharacterized protein n=1 Tax=Archangium gephyra TaxID=48 RepID=A0AAC8THD3_9BACT|nr:Hypothetical protein AA314_07763 [Archangium gephyra]
MLLLTACDDGIRSVQDMRESSPQVDIKRLDGQLTVDIYLPSRSPSTFETPQGHHCPELDPSVTAEVRGGTLQALEPGGLGMYGRIGCSIPRVLIRDAGREVGITLRDATGSVELSLAPTPELSVVSSTSVARGGTILVRTGATPPPAQSTFHLRDTTATEDAVWLTATREPEGLTRLLVPQTLEPVWTGPAKLTVVYEGGATCDGLQCRQVKTSFAFSGVEILP